MPPASVWAVASCPHRVAHSVLGGGGVIVTGLLDIETVLGEAWCVTIVRDLEPAEVLLAMGVGPDSVRPMRSDEVTFGDPTTEVVLAHRLSAPERWTLAPEYDGPTGFVGWQPEVLRKLTSARRVACVLTSTPDDLDVCYAEEGRIISR